MKSPFPGMDPYIEVIDEWEDFHQDLCGHIKGSILEQLPDGYFVKLAKRSYITLADEEGKETKTFAPDVKVTAPEARGGRSSGTALLEPATEEEMMTMEMMVTDEFHEAFIEIYEKAEWEGLVTSIEVFSPSNKRAKTEGWRQLLRKRQGLLESKTNLVEIDLLRAGTRLPMRTLWPDSPYTLLVCHGKAAPRCRVWKGHYRTRLPVIPIPLRDPDADLQLDLQPLIEMVYRRCRFDKRIQYDKPLDLPLLAEDVVWLAETLKARGEVEQVKA